MEISFQDSPKFSPFSSQSGQGILEYILVLLVAIAVIMGGIYQLNDAFKSWANNYFGNYIACLLETGDLPSIGGTPGDSGVCNQLFEPFSLAKGRRLKPIGPTAGSGDGSGPGDSSRGRSEKGEGNNGRPSFQVAGGGGRSRGSIGWAGSGGRPQRVKITPRSASGGGEETNTGSTRVSSAGGDLRSQQISKSGRRLLLDNGSVTGDDKDERRQKRQSVGSSTNSGMENRSKNRIPLRMNPPKKEALANDEPLTFGNFIRILLIAAIIIALVMVIGGQLMSMGKMEQ